MFWLNEEIILRLITCLENMRTRTLKALYLRKINCIQMINLDLDTLFHKYCDQEINRSTTITSTGMKILMLSDFI